MKSPWIVIEEVAKLEQEWLLNVINFLLATQTFPQEWKRAKVILYNNINMHVGHSRYVVGGSNQNRLQ